MAAAHKRNSEGNCVPNCPRCAEKRDIRWGKDGRPYVRPPTGWERWEQEHGTPLNPGIQNTVKMLSEHGFETTDSGDGKTHDFGCDRPFPYVSIVVHTPTDLIPETHRLRDLLAECGVEIQPVGPEACPQIQASYDPATYVGVIDLLHVDDDLLFPED